jgi:hypothetical protein
MALVAEYATNGKCTVTLAEHGKAVKDGQLALDSLTLHCDDHGDLSVYSMVRFPKYSAARRAALFDASQHLGLDKPAWHLVGLAPQHRDY